MTDRKTQEPNILDTLGPREKEIVTVLGGIATEAKLNKVEPKPVLAKVDSARGLFDVKKIAAALHASGIGVTSKQVNIKAKNDPQTVVGKGVLLTGRFYDQPKIPKLNLDDLFAKGSTLGDLFKGGDIDDLFGLGKKK